MEKNFRYPFLFSLFFHFLLFYSTSRLAFRKIVSVPIPIELIRISLPSSAPAENKPVTQKGKKVEEVVLPKKETIKKKKEVKKEEAVKPKAVSEEKPVKEEKKIVSPPPPTPFPASAVSPGSGVSVESAKFHYTYYLNLIRERIGKNWNWSTSETKKKTIIYFRISKDGSISQIRTKESSKDESFDLAGLRAVEISAPFPPLPAGFPEEYLGVYFEFSLQ